MADKVEFRSKLSGILDIAVQEGERISKEVVEQYFEEDQLTMEQMDLVFDYLLAQKIAVLGYTKEGGSVVNGEEIKSEQLFTAEDLAYLEAYGADVSAIKVADVEQMKLLFEDVLKGDSKAKSRVTESYLARIIEVGKSMFKPGFFVGDLIQEGTMSLIMALETIPDVQKIGYEEVDKYLLSEVKQGIQLMIEESNELNTRDQKMVEQVKELDDVITKLTEDLGRKVTIDELVLYTEKTEEEIIEILKLTGEDVEEVPEMEEPIIKVVDSDNK